MREILVKCLGGELAPASALGQMMYVSENAALVRQAVDTVTGRAAELSRSGDRLLHDRLDELTQIAVDPELGVEKLEQRRRAAPELP